MGSIWGFNRGYKLVRQCKSIVSMEWKQVTSDAQGHMLRTMNMKKKFVASMDNNTTTISQERLFFEKEIVRLLERYKLQQVFRHRGSRSGFEGTKGGRRGEETKEEDD